MHRGLRCISMIGEISHRRNHCRSNSYSFSVPVPMPRSVPINRVKICNDEMKSWLRWKHTHDDFSPGTSRYGEYEITIQNLKRPKV